MKLSPRLQSIANMIEYNSRLADIGTDHAYLPIYLVKNNICSRVIATDIRTGPLDKARKNIGIYRLQNQIQVRKGYGLSPIGIGEVDCAILAGMGGHLICDILKADKEKVKSIKHFIIQPMQAPEYARLYLYKHNYKIHNEMLVKDSDKIYQVIAVGHGKERIDDDIFLEIGKKMIEDKDPLLKELLCSKIKEQNSIMQKIDDKYSVNAQKRIEECKVRLTKYEEVLKCL